MTATSTTTLGDYLGAPRPAWDWVNLDCCRWVDGWVQQRGYPSPIAMLGLTYDSERSALLAIRRGGGLVALWTRGMCLAGVREADDAQAGDVAIIGRPTECGTNEAAAIFTGERWMTLGVRGFHCGPADVLASWRPDGHPELDLRQSRAAEQSSTVSAVVRLVTRAFLSIGARRSQRPRHFGRIA